MLDLGVDVVLQVLNVGDESHAGREQKTHHKDELHGEVRVGCNYRQSYAIFYNSLFVC